MSQITLCNATIENVIDKMQRPGLWVVRIDFASFDVPENPQETKIEACILRKVSIRALRVLKRFTIAFAAVLTVSTDFKPRHFNLKTECVPHLLANHFQIG